TRLANHQASTAPSMKNSPWATFTTRITPNTSDSPSAVSASTAAVTVPSSTARKRWGPKSTKLPVIPVGAMRAAREQRSEPGSRESRDSPDEVPDSLAALGFRDDG